MVNSIIHLSGIIPNTSANATEKLVMSMQKVSAAGQTAEKLKLDRTLTQIWPT